MALHQSANVLSDALFVVGCLFLVFVVESVLVQVSYSQLICQANFSQLQEPY